MRKFILTAVLLALAVSPAYAQQWDQVNGSMQVKSGPTAPLVIIDQTAAGQKIASFRNNGTEKCYIDVSGNLNCAGTFTLTGQFLAGDGSASAPSYSFASETGLGFYRRASAEIGWAMSGSNWGKFAAGQVSIFGTTAKVLFGDAEDVSLSRGAADRLDLATGDSFKIVSGGLGVGVTNTTAGAIQSSSDIISGAELVSIARRITAGAGTGITVNSGGLVATEIYKVTIDRTAFVCNNTVCDVTIGTLPAKTQILTVLADLTQVFACTATCTSSTLSMVFGRGSGGAQWLASFDADAATGQFGDADAELGTTMTRAAAIQAGSFESWSSTQAAVLRLTSGTGNIGNGSATNLSQGSITIYLETKVFP